MVTFKGNSSYFSTATLARRTKEKGILHSGGGYPIAVPRFGFGFLFDDRGSRIV